MHKRPLPTPAATALDIIVNAGSCSIGANDLELRMHQRGFTGRAVGEALRAFARRGWLMRTNGVVEITEEEFNSKDVERKKFIPSKRKHARLPRGLFG